MNGIWAVPLLASILFLGLISSQDAFAGPPPQTTISSSITSSKDPVVPGETFSWIQTITNTGPVSATSVTTGEFNSLAITFQSVTSSHGGVCSVILNALWSCDIPNIPPGETATVLVTVMVFPGYIPGEQFPLQLLPHTDCSNCVNSLDVFFSGPEVSLEVTTCEFEMSAQAGEFIEGAPGEFFQLIPIKPNQQNIIPIRVESELRTNCGPISLDITIGDAEGNVAGQFDMNLPPFDFFFESSALPETPGTVLDPNSFTENLILDLPNNVQTGLVEIKIIGKEVDGDFSQSVMFEVVVSGFDIQILPEESDETSVKIRLLPDKKIELFETISVFPFFQVFDNPVEIQVFTSAKDIIELSLVSPPSLPPGFDARIEDTQGDVPCTLTICIINFFDPIFGFDPFDGASEIIDLFPVIDETVPEGFHIFEIVGMNLAGDTKTARIGFQVVHNTKVGSDFKTAAELNKGGLNFVGLEFSNIESSGNTIVDLMLNGPPPPSGFAIQSFSGSRTYLDITTTATTNGPITITIDFDGRGLSGAQEQSMKLFHFNENSGEWEDVTTIVDSDNDRIIGVVNNLSIFTILSPLELNGGQAIGGTLIPIDTFSLLLVGTQSTAAWLVPVIVAGIGIGLVFLRRK